MDKQMDKQKTDWTIVALVIIVAIGAFAIVWKIRPDKRDFSNMSLQEIVDSRRTWDPAFESWTGKVAANFTVKDLQGKEHKLSDYRGKDVLVVFWATWCPNCKIEIPHLIDLRKTVSKDELAIIAISNERPDVLKKFAVDSKMNYTVIPLGSSILPAPFANVNAIPATFFIDRQGKIKLAVEGLLSLAETKAIMKNE